MSKFSHDAADDDARARQYLDVFFENSRANNEFKKKQDIDYHDYVKVYFGT